MDIFGRDDFAADVGGAAEMGKKDAGMVDV